MKEYIYIATITALFFAIIAGSFFNFRTVFATPSATVDATTQISICGNNIAEGGEHCDGADFKGRACTDLGFTGGTLSCSPACQFITTSCVSDAEVRAETDFTSALGGTRSFANIDGTTTTVTLPGGCHATDVRLQFFSYANNFFSISKPAPPEKSFIGKTYDFIFIDTDGRRVQTLCGGTTIVLNYRDADVGGLDESAFEPRTHNGSSWQLIPGFTIDTDSNRVSFSTANFSFSSFAIFGGEFPPLAPPPPPPPAGGGGGFFAIFTPAIFMPPAKPAPKHPDLNKDGDVDIRDFSILLYHIGRTVAPDSPYDLNSDGIIDIVDVSIMLYHWGK